MSAVAVPRGRGRVERLRLRRRTTARRRPRHTGLGCVAVPVRASVSVEGLGLARAVFGRRQGQEQLAPGAPVGDAGLLAVLGRPRWACRSAGTACRAGRRRPGPGAPGTVMRSGRSRLARSSRPAVSSSAQPLPARPAHRSGVNGCSSHSPQHLGLVDVPDAAGDALVEQHLGHRGSCIDRSAPCAPRSRRGRRRAGTGRGRASPGRGCRRRTAWRGRSRRPAPRSTPPASPDLDARPGRSRALFRHCSLGRYRCHEPDIRMWVCSTMPSSKPISRCLPRLSTCSIDGRRPGAAGPRSRGASKRRASACPSNADRSAAAVRWMVSPSGMPPEVTARAAGTRFIGTTAATWAQGASRAPQHQPPVAVGEARPPAAARAHGRRAGGPAVDRARSPGCAPGRP